MKIILVVLSAFLAVSSAIHENVDANALKVLGSEDELKNEVDPHQVISANMNAYFDLIMIQFGPWIQRSGFIPMPLPDVSERIEHRPLLITYHGDLHLTRGELTRFMSTERFGPAVMSYNRPLQFLRIAAAVSLRNLAFRYDYDAAIMGLGPNGWLEGTTNAFTIAADFIFDLNDFTIYMQDFRLVSFGNLTIQLRGNILIDWLGNIVINSMTRIFETTITNIITQQFQNLLQATIDEMNSNRRSSRAQTPEDFQKIVDGLLSFQHLQDKMKINL